MMFGIYEAIAAAQAFQAVQADEMHFWRSIRDLPADAQAKLIEERRVLKEKIQQESTAERRHQELCRAIRGSRVRGIGLFY